MTRRYIKVEIDDEDVSSQVLRCKIVQTYGDAIPTAELELSSQYYEEEGYTAPTNASTLEIWLDENDPPTTKVFDGYIDNMQPQQGMIRISGKDQLSLMLNDMMNHYFDTAEVEEKCYPDGRISSIFNAIVKDYAGLNTNTTYGYTTSYTTGKLVDVYANFNDGSVNVGDIVKNFTVSGEPHANVTAIDSDTQLSVNSNIFNASNRYMIYPATGQVVHDSGTTITLNKFDCHDADPFERCRKLADTLNWCFFYKADTDLVYFQEKNFTTNSNSITIGGSSNNVMQIPQWEYDRSELINILKVEGIEQQVEYSQTFEGYGSTTTFNLDYEPSTIAVYYNVDVNFSTTAPTFEDRQLGNVEGGLTEADFTVDKKTKTITFAVAPDAPTTSNNILVIYSYSIPAQTTIRDQTSIDTYGNYSKKITFTDITEVDDITARATNILEKYKEPFKSATVKRVWKASLDYSPGQLVNVTDNLNIPNVDNTFFIVKVTQNYPDSTVELEVGDKQWKTDELLSDLVERMKQGEENDVGSTQSTDTDLVSETIQFDLGLQTCDVVLKNAAGAVITSTQYTSGGVYTNRGFNVILNRAFRKTPDYNHIGSFMIGTGSTAASVDDTSMGNMFNGWVTGSPLYYSKELDSFAVHTSNETVTTVAHVPTGLGTGCSFCEYGEITSTVGSVVNRFVFPTITKGDFEQVYITTVFVRT